MTFIFWLTIGLLALPLYVYFGYPLVLWFLSRLRAAPIVPELQRDKSITLVISCYNEAKVIAQKLENSLTLDYPKDLLDILVISDGSEDGSDAIVQGYTDRGVRLIRQEGRLGKTMGLNLALANSTSEYVVFSDANAMYEADALLQLIRHFGRPEVGYVVGAALYTDGQDNAAASNEDLYWQYELALKEWESRLHSVVGGDGAIYAIRRTLWEPLQQKDINDFVNPLQIVAKGYRGVFTRDARCYEETAGDFTKEAKRKERIVNRSVRGLMRVKSVMNPFRTGWFAFQVVSHKLLRWLLPYFACLGMVGAAVLATQQYVLFQLMTLGAILFFMLATLGAILYKRPKFPMLIAVPYYLVMVNYYAMRGIANALRGQTQVTWSSVRPGQQNKAIEGSGLFGIAIFTVFLVLSVIIPYV